MDVFFDSILIPMLQIVGPPIALFIAAQLGMLTMNLAKRMKIKMNAEQQEELRQLIRGGVLHTQQTYVRQLKKEKEKDGHLSAGDAGQAAMKAIRLATADLGKEGIKKLAKLTGKSVHSVVADVVEEEVAAMKLIPKESVPPQG